MPAVNDFSLFFSATNDEGQGVEADLDAVEAVLLEGAQPAAQEVRIGVPLRQVDADRGVWGGFDHGASVAIRLLLVEGSGGGPMAGRVIPGSARSATGFPRSRAGTDRPRFHVTAMKKTKSAMKGAIGRPRSGGVGGRPHPCGRSRVGGAADRARADRVRATRVSP